ncbi:hypothetical protein ACFU6K_04610 [Kitasatospora sp. NPDC057512]|uniref:hypothetical protein n=1 Tax=Kitasatospora sp. NPDC057512 TaxID=3346154 RepID=UPI003693BA2F
MCDPSPNHRRRPLPDATREARAAVVIVVILLVTRSPHLSPDAPVLATIVAGMFGLRLRPSRRPREL